jgi:hypothetical protein
MKPLRNMQNMRKSSAAILVTLLVLAVAIAALALTTRSSIEPLPAGKALTILAEDAVLKEYSLEDLKALPAVSIQKRIASGSHEDEEGIYTGIPLETLMTDALASGAAGNAEGTEGAGNPYSEYIFTCADGFVASAFASDVEMGENVLIVYAKDGADLKGKEEGGKGPLRIVIAKDEFGNRSAQNLTGIKATP